MFREEDGDRIGFLSRSASQHPDSELIARADEKEKALGGWIDERKRDLGTLANSPTLRDKMRLLAAAAPDAPAARGRIVSELRPQPQRADILPGWACLAWPALKGLP